MKISIFGTGYVGLVTAVCFAEMGNDVIAVDIDENKIKQLNSGVCPIYEPGLEDMLKQNYEAGRLQFTTDAKESVKASKIVMIAVGTPSDLDGSADLKFVLKVAQTIAEHMDSYRLIVTKSTVPIGTQQKIKACVESILKKRGLDIDFDVASNPEFLREGNAIDDSLQPTRVVIGADSPKAEKALIDLYKPFVKNGNPILTMDPLSAEMTKYAANAMLATKISLMNEFSRICEGVGADIEKVRHGIGSDPRIGPHFIFAGVGYGGSCLPKDVRALIHSGLNTNQNVDILISVDEGNQVQRDRFTERVVKYFGSMKDKTIAVWGIAFKPGTDDIREAPALEAIKRFLDEGATVQAFDPVAAQVATKEYFENHKNFKTFKHQNQALEKADALVIFTEWKSFREPDFDKIKSLMKSPVVFDGRNLYEPQRMKELGFQYHSVGRPS